MILNYSVTNFKSIENEVNISFIASKLKDETEYENYFNYNKKRILKAIALYGANATGKSTILDSIKIFRMLITSNYSCGNVYTPFSLKGINTKPIVFKISFLFNKVEYYYEISFNKVRILKETLKIKTTNKFNNVFSRINNDIVFNKHLKSYKIAVLLSKSIRNDKPFISSFNNVDVGEYTVVYNYFYNNIMPLTLEIKTYEDVIPNKNIVFSEDFKRFAIKFLKACDIHIEDILIEKRKIELPLNNPAFLEEYNGLFFIHKVKNIKTKVPFVFESLGTKKMILLADMIYRALQNETFVIIDELESSLHPDLVKLIIESFFDTTLNKNYSQLLFSSYQTNLLSNYFLRRDQIIFVYKDEEKNGTTVIPLKDFKIRKSENIEKSYLAGRFNTSPNVERIELWKKLNQNV